MSSVVFLPSVLRARKARKARSEGRKVEARWESYSREAVL